MKIQIKIKGDPEVTIADVMEIRDKGRKIYVLDKYNNKVSYDKDRIKEFKVCITEP